MPYLGPTKIGRKTRGCNPLFNVGGMFGTCPYWRRGVSLYAPTSFAQNHAKEVNKGLKPLAVSRGACSNMPLLV